MCLTLANEEGDLLKQLKNPLSLIECQHRTRVGINDRRIYGTNRINGPEFKLFRWGTQNLLIPASDLCCVGLELRWQIAFNCLTSLSEDQNFVELNAHTPKKISSICGSLPQVPHCWNWVRCTQSISVKRSKTWHDLQAIWWQLGLEKAFAVVADLHPKTRQSTRNLLFSPGRQRSLACWLGMAPWSQTPGAFPELGASSGLTQMDVYPQVIPFLVGFSHYFHHPFWGTPIFGNTHILLKDPAFGMEYSCIMAFHNVASQCSSSFPRPFRIEARSCARGLPHHTVCFRHFPIQQS